MSTMDRADFLQDLSRYHIDLSKEHLERLDAYVALLVKWQRKFNLVGPETLSSIYRRHILDCLQLAQHVPRGTTVLDVGAGAGLPSIVLAIVCDVEFVTACERVGKKVQFMNQAKRELGLSVRFNAVQKDVRDLTGAYDVITARALADLEKLFSLTHHLSHGRSIFLFPKGENFQEEIFAANQKWLVTTKTEKSITSNRAEIVIATDVKNK